LPGIFPKLEFFFFSFAYYVIKLAKAKIFLTKPLVLFFSLCYYINVMSQNFRTIVGEITDKDSRYNADAYVFIMEALSFTQKKYKAPRHVSGDQMLTGLKDLLMDKYGPMTMAVLEHWGIKSTEDFGNIIFNLVDGKVLSKTDEDKIEIFRDGYDFEEVFEHGYRKKLNKKISRMK